MKQERIHISEVEKVVREGVDMNAMLKKAM
jgi:hypothetical protein